MLAIALVKLYGNTPAMARKLGVTFPTVEMFTMSPSILRSVPTIVSHVEVANIFHTVHVTLLEIVY